MFRELLARITDAAKMADAVVVRRARESIKPGSALGGLVADLTRTREELESENAALPTGAGGDEAPRFASLVHRNRFPNGLQHRAIELRFV